MVNQFRNYRMLNLPTDKLQKMDELGEKGIPFLFIISFDGSVVHVWQRDEIPEFSVPQIKLSGNERQNRPDNFIFRIYPVPFEKYSASFSKTMEHIRRGDTYLINLTMPTRIESSLSLSQIYECSDAPYRILFGDKFVCFSPEIFVKITGNTISSFPMKGTIDASCPDAEKLILGNEKELAEHNTIVDLIRNDLSIVANQVRVKRFRYAERINTNRGSLIQISSEISGVLLSKYRRKIGTVFSLLLPAGSFTGDQKKKTVEIIKKVEFYDRCYYTGIFGWFDGQNVDSGVMIRFIEKDKNTLIYKSGGGITYMSDPFKEYDELIKKVYVPFS